MARSGVSRGIGNSNTDYSWAQIDQRRRRKERLEYDTTPAKTVLAIVGVAVVILLLWLDYQGY